MTLPKVSKVKSLVIPSDEQEWPGVDSRYRLIVVAALRSKQLLHGATPRIETDPLRHRNTSIALEEVKRGLVSFTLDDGDAAIAAGIHADGSDDKDVGEARGVSQNEIPALLRS